MRKQAHNPGLTLVLGATGKSGRRVAARLAERGVAVRRGSRAASPSFDWSRPDGWDAALTDVGAVYLAYPADLPLDGATERIGAFVARAVTAGVERLVLLTGRGEEECRRQERLVLDAPLASTVVRSAWFDQNFTEGGFVELVRARRFDLPRMDVPEPFVDLDDVADDVADVAVAAVTERVHDGRVYDVTGPRGMTLRDVAAELSAALGAPIECHPRSHVDVLAKLTAAGLPADAVGLMDYLFGTLLDGRNAHLGDGVERALGRAPRDFTDFARGAASADAWTEVAA